MRHSKPVDEQQITQPAPQDPQATQPEHSTHGDDARNERLPGSVRSGEIRRTLDGVFVLNLLLAGAKLGYGLLTGSVSMTADGVNSLMDGFSNVVELIGISVAARPPDPNHLYGHRRFETLTSLVIVVFMLLALIQILRSAWQHWRSGSVPTVNLGSFLVMIGALIVVTGMSLWTYHAGRRNDSSLLTAEAHHLASDIAISLSVIAGLIAAHFGYPQADVVVALIVAAVIAWAIWEIVHQAVLTLSDVAVVSVRRIDQAARSVPGVRGAHNIRSRGGDGLIWVDLHIQVDPNLRVDRAHDIASDVAERVEAEVGEPADVTVHIEPADPEHLRPSRGYRPDQ